LTLARAYEEKVSCEVSLNEEFGRVCRLENVNPQTMRRVEVDGKSFKYVFFRNSNIEFFTDEFVEQLEGVEYLNANEVGLMHIDGNALGRLPELLIFWGSQNDIESLDAGAFSGNFNLELICLKFNRINFVHHDAFHGLNRLFKLDLSSNRLVKLERIFDTLTNLMILDLSSNRIENLSDEVFKGLGKLRQLNLSKNQLKFLYAEALDPLVRLQTIDLCFNKLTVINKRILKYNKKLTKILFCGNQIRAIDSKFFANRKKKLDLMLLRSNACIDDDFDLVNGTLSKNDVMKFSSCYENFNQHVRNS
jgi:hypothetical protein